MKLIEPNSPPAALLHEAIQPPADARVHAATCTLADMGALSLVGPKSAEFADECAGAAGAAAGEHATGDGGGGARMAEDVRVTPLGKLVASLPVSVPLGRLVVIGEALGVGRQASILAAAMALPDPFLQPYTQAESVHADESALAVEDVSYFKPRLAHFHSCARSDPLATLALFTAWQRALSDGGTAAAAQYAHTQHASYK